MALARRIVAILFCISAPLAAQFQPPLEAETPEEFDHYLTVEGASDPRAVTRKTEEFQRRWPKSNLLPRVWELRFLALQKLGNAAEARRAGDEALRLSPGNLTVRAALAVQMASDDLSAAERHARAVLEDLDRTAIRRTVPLKKYLQTAAQLRAQAHVALGLVSYRRGDLAAAVWELEEADRLAPEPALSYRLGRLYGVLGRTEEARRRLREAASASDPELAERGRKALAELR